MSLASDWVDSQFMANHIHLLLKPQDANQRPKLVHWVGWYASMLLNCLSGRCGHGWEARYDATSIAPEDHLSVDREDTIDAFTTCRPSQKHQHPCQVINTANDCNS
jgi:REP element-mobilizing transposase RayT